MIFCLFCSVICCTGIISLEICVILHCSFSRCLCSPHVILINNILHLRILCKRNCFLLQDCFKVDTYKVTNRKIAVRLIAFAPLCRKICSFCRVVNALIICVCFKVIKLIAVFRGRILDSSRLIICRITIIILEYN